MTVPSVCETAVAHYLSKGITKDVAVGLASVLYHESKLNPTEENNSGTDAGGVINPKGAYGIAQWNGPRQNALKIFAAGKNEDVSALNTQLDFVLTECANSYPQAWAAILKPGMTYQAFIPIFVAEYERPANEAAEVNDAMSIATPLYALSISPTPAAAPAPVPTPAPTPVVVAPAPAATTTPAPTSTPATPGVTPMDQELITALAPIVESLAAGLFRALITQLSTTTSGAAAPTAAGAAPTPAPTIDIGSLVTTLLPLLMTQLNTALPALIQTELAKLTPAAGVKS